MFSRKTEQTVDKAAKLAEMRSQLSEDVNSLVNDEDCHRFLTARNFDMPKSLEMINKWATWWRTPFTDYAIDNKELTPRDLLTTPGDNKESIFAEAFLYANLGEDIEGHPIYTEKIGLAAARHDILKKNFTEDELVVRHIRQQELMISRIKSSAVRHNKPISKCVIICDLKGIPLIPDSHGVKTFIRAIVVAQANHPERLHCLYAINAPVYFTAIWALVKPFVDPLTAKKIQIIGANYQPILKQNIAEDQLPLEYGGTRENYSWTWPENFEQ